MNQLKAVKALLDASRSTAEPEAWAEARRASAWYFGTVCRPDVKQGGLWYHAFEGPVFQDEPEIKAELGDER